MKKIYLIFVIFCCSCIANTYLVLDCNNPNYVFLNKHNYKKETIDDICKTQKEENGEMKIGIPSKGERFDKIKSIE